jgi:beta-phosphoglucomutase
MIKNLKGIFFDMDGVLIDSMRYHVAAWIKAFARFGYHPDELEFYLNEGVKHPITVRQRLKKLGVDNPDEETVKNIYTLKREILEQTADFKPSQGILELIDKLKGRVKLGVVTGSIPSVVNRVISKFFNGYFDFVVDYESTEKGKPDPEPYLYAIKLSGLPEESIIAIENAPTGIASAVDAGLTCWAVCTTLEAEHLDKAQKVFRDFKEIEKALFVDEYISM